MSKVIDINSKRDAKLELDQYKDVNKELEIALDSGNNDDYMKATISALITIIFNYVCETEDKERFLEYLSRFVDKRTYEGNLDLADEARMLTGVIESIKKSK